MSVNNLELASISRHVAEGFSLLINSISICDWTGTAYIVRNSSFLKMNDHFGSLYTFQTVRLVKYPVEVLHDRCLDGCYLFRRWITRYLYLRLPTVRFWPKPSRTEIRRFAYGFGSTTDNPKEAETEPNRWISWNSIFFYCNFFYLHSNLFFIICLPIAYPFY